MKAVLDIIKQYKWEIGFGAGAILGIVLIFFGLGGMQPVQTELNAAWGLKNDLGGMARGSNPINEKAIDAEQARIDSLRSGYERVLAFVRERNLYPPLTPRAFPDGSRDDRTAFRREYQAENRSWLEILKAGHVPTDDEVARARDIMDAERPETDLLGADVEDVEPTDADEEKDEDEMTPEVFASIRNAESSYCYATAGSFQISDAADFNGPMWGGPPPDLEIMWEAQLEVWLQRSVVDAIATINETAAERLTQAGEEPWVGNLPVKDLLSIQTSRYYIKEGLEVESGGERDRPVPPTGPDATFTKLQSDELHEVMRFTVQLVIDARDLPEVIAGLSRRNFHVPTRVAYESVPPNVDMDGKIYGEEPVIKLTVDFDTVFFSELYLPLMPQPILDLLGKQRPEIGDQQGV